MTTLIKWPSRHGYSLFCDDLRREENGKITLVGVYGSEMIIFGSMPASLPKLAVIVFYIERPDESNEPIELVIYLPGDSDDMPSYRAALPIEAVQEFRNNRPPTPETDNLHLIFRLDAVFSPISIKQEGAIRVRLIRGDAEIGLGSLRIRAQPPVAPSPDTGPV